MICLFCQGKMDFQETHILVKSGGIFWECSSCKRLVDLDVMIACYDVFDLTTSEVNTLKDTRVNMNTVDSRQRTITDLSLLNLALLPVG